MSTQFTALLPFINAASEPDDFDGEAGSRAEPSAESASNPSKQATPCNGLERSDRDSTETETQPNSPFAPYRDRTAALLRRYFHMSIEIGRLPALLGREFFRANVTSTQMHTFEDQVIFVIDVERCLDRLNRRGKKMIAVFIFQEYTFDEAVAEFGWARRTICRALPRALDDLSDMLLRHKLLEPFPHDEELLCGDRRSRGSGSARTDTCQ